MFSNCFKHSTNILSVRNILVIILRHDYSKQANFKKPNDLTFTVAKPFEAIPGPSRFEFIRGFLPGGVHYKKSTCEIANYHKLIYGPLARLPAIFGNPISLIATSPEDYPIIFRNEGLCPYRRSFNTLKYYREYYRRDFFNGTEGVMSTNGEKWAKVRTAVNPILMQPNNARLYLNTLSEANHEFLKRIRNIRDPITQEMPDTFEEEINRLTFESIGAVVLDMQIGSKTHDSIDAKILFTHLRRFFDLAYKLDLMPSIWPYIRTPAYIEMMNTLDTLTSICTKYINEALTRIECVNEGRLSSEMGKEKSVLEKLVSIDEKVATVMALDMMLAGVDTTSTTLVGILLCIAKNPKKQATLFNEIVRILPQKDSNLTMDNLQHLPYLRACIKEGIRLNPLVPGTMRRLPVDVVLSGYHVPKGVDILIAANLLLSDEKYVPHANDFLPERWLRNTQRTRSAGANGKCSRNALAGEIGNRFIYQPFGLGARSCSGRRIANLELEITIANLIRNFHIEFNYPTENAFKAKLINVPAIPLKFQFKERQS